ncbi:MAG: carboxylating nicotinate-nucleotide diphosphorylase [Alphaproteobacteria bacterium]
MTLALAFTNPPSRADIEPIVRRALNEDIGSGDITTEATVGASKAARGLVLARKPGVIAGLIASDLAFYLLDPSVRLETKAPDGSSVKAKETIAEVSGPARALLTAERTAMNFLGQLSGIATATRELVEAVKGTRARITCTRKTTPGLRLLEKYAVRCGGGVNHRFGLYDAVLIKDNHIIAAGGIEAAVRAVAARGHEPKSIEVEVDSLAQLEKVLSLGVGRILLDNMEPSMLRSAVQFTNGRALLEASGGVSRENVRAIAETGVDFISSGAITHSAPALDVALDL